ncbi:erythrocyte membrane protein 1 [Plasmodium falciparum IGH-CR14]|uniref:Erythrocyte membrane protein 1 n=1 Tax=Plasmodium falciparum IGH-CR14 TaxID=580059 RepID=A0A0L1I3Z0_PLAFA|nr:erythrocyte membrane protein 1 [Plasmodium falciparum IGH-CR14]
MGPGSTGTKGETAKHVLDSIGEKVYDKAKNAANVFRDDLKGNLQEATNRSGELVSTADTCRLVNDYYNKCLNGKRYPCDKRSPVRFSDEYGGQCTHNRIKDNETHDNACGACAPYRRLHLCDYNLEKMNSTKIKDKNVLLAEVCMAAKYEGNSINTHYTPYQATYGDSASQLCTVLARSFADIGDIIRGKDLYLGDDKKDKEQKKKLEENLKKIFGNIYEELKNGKTNGAEARYGSDAPYYYKLREDWWNANRKEIWKAITCHARDNAQYFRGTCNGEKRTEGYCRCDDNPNVDPPTYFDYVPQYLRWFEEWAEDFCTKRKHKLQNAIKNCRDYAQNLYCSGNGYDCKETIRAQNKLVEGDNCHKCSVSCKPFVKWIDNQKLEFEKQEKKYTKEMEKADGTKGTTIRIGDKTINNWYVKEFYEKLKESEYGKVDDFLKLLSKEKICQDSPTVGNQKADAANFTKDETNETFCRTKYCKPCPLCGLSNKSPPWQAIDESTCTNGEIRNFDENNSTPINLLVKDVTGTSIVDKLGGLCNDSSKPTIQTWKCHYEGAEMFEDSIKWRKEHDKCINNNNTCKKECRTPCKCFAKWVERMKVEWEQIEKHYVKEEFSGKYGIQWTPYGTLEWNLQNIYFPSIEKAYPGVKFVEEIKEKKIIDENIKDLSSVTKNNNSITKLLEYEEQDAKKCTGTHNDEKCNQQKKPKAPTTDPGGLARAATGPQSPSGTPADGGAGPSDDEEDEDVPEDENEEASEEAESTGDTEQVEEETPPEDTEAVKDREVQVEGPKETQLPDACNIVKDLFEKPKNTFKEACEQKYAKNNSRLGWRCIPTSGDKTGTDEARAGRSRREASGDTDSAVPTTGNDGAPGKSGSNQGSICVPPRRRRLYIGKIKDWAGITVNGDSSESSVSGSGTESQAGEASQVQDAASTSTTESSQLRDAFIKSAAVETFFLWDRYKKEKKPQGVGARAQPPQQPVASSDDPQSKLEKGEIPEDFLRLMFYTLGDYRDICVGKTPDGIDTVSASGDKNIDKIEQKIKSVIENSGSTPRTPGPPNSGQPITRESWWSKYAEPIWNGMICALTYKENGTTGDKTNITQDGTLKEKLLENGKPKNTQYQYQTAKLKEEASGEKTTLTDFISRPPYFRYLEEWGQNFCKERKKRLDQIYKDCKVENGDVGRCSGYGEECKIEDISKEGLFADLKCPSCATPCNSYRKWIERKGKEFEKQKNAYGEQKEKCKKESKSAEGDKDDKEFCTKLEKKVTTAAAFLQNLGPCKVQNGEGKTIFDENDDTFKHTQYCDPCSEFKFKCENGKCKSSLNGKCQGKITVDTFDTMGEEPQEVVMRVSDNSGNEFTGDLQDCNGKGIFKSIKENKWKCRNFCGYVVCKSENGNGRENQNKIILINALLKRWLEYFFEDYNRIQKKVKAYMNSSDGCKCIKGCIEKWVQEKTKEWQKINDTYLEQYKNDDGGNTLTNFLEQFEQRTEFKNAIKPCPNLDKFEKSCGLNSDKPSQNGHQDAIDCMIKKLETKAQKCQEHQNSGEPDTPCQKSPAPVGDDDEPLEEENPVTQPNICPAQQPEDQTEETCEEPKQEKEKEESEKGKDTSTSGGEGSATPELPVPTTENSETNNQTPKDTKPLTPPAAPPPHPTLAPADEPFDSTILQTTIPFGVALALGSIAFLFLKKKTKSSVGNLFQILQIPKSDYDIPTKLSPNRYIPYTSGKYRGKRYIYLEGDSGTDSGYTDHYSDITSSSESEYEEMDINDIYVPGSPKYKTLIEVVLEPSGNNTTASGNNTTASGKNTPSDTQNDIQNDGIPSSKITDNEWNTLKDDFISQYIQSEQPNDVPNDYKSENVTLNTQPNTLYFDKPQEKPFIMSIHDRNLYSGEEYNYNVNMSTNSMDDIPISGKNDVYSGIDLINDSLNNNNVDIYDELLKRKENELFGTNHVKQTSIHSVAKLTNSDPIHNQLELFHKWLDRHRDMCEKWNNKEEVLNKLKEEWENETHSGNTHPSDSNKTLNTDVSIQIHMDNPKPINQFTNMDTILEDLDKPFNEPYYYDMYDDDIYYDVNDHDTSTVDSNAMDIPSKVQIEMDVNTKLVKEKYPIADVWDI